MERIDKKIIVSGFSLLGIAAIGTGIAHADVAQQVVDKAVESVTEPSNLSTQKTALSKSPLKIAKNKVTQVSDSKREQIIKSAVNSKTYAVKSGDSLWSIANHHNVNVEELVLANNGSDLISVGQKITLPSQTPTTSVESEKTDSSPVTVDTEKSTAAETALEPKTDVSVDDSLNSQVGNEPAVVQAPTDSSSASENITSSDVTVVSQASAPSVSSVSSQVDTSLTQTSSNQVSETLPDMATSKNTNDTTASSVVQTASQKSDIADQGQNTVESVTAATDPETTTAHSVAEGSDKSLISQSESASNVQPVNKTQPKTDTNINGIVSLAKNLVIQDIPYEWGGTNTQGFDCSGFVSYVFQNAAGISLPHSSVVQESYVQQKAVTQAQPGDLLFWGTPGASYHVAIYIGGNQYVSAPDSGENVRIETISANFEPSFAGHVE